MAWVLIDDENRQAVGPFETEAAALDYAAANDWEVSDQGDPVGWYILESIAPRRRHTVGGKTSDKGWPYGTRHDMDCPGCEGTSFLASPRSETYWAS